MRGSIPRRHIRLIHTMYANRSGEGSSQEGVAVQEFGKADVEVLSADERQADAR